MKRIKIILLLSLSLILGFTLNLSFAAEEYSPVVIKKGAFLKALNLVEISTVLADIGDEVSFISPIDMFVGEINAVPQDTKFYGHIEDIKEPVQGTNGAIKIKIDKMITPNRRTIPLNAYIYSQNDNYIGGELTPAKYYHRMPHYTQGWGGGVLQYTPSNVRFFGQHTLIKPGAELLIIINEDLKI